MKVFGKQGSQQKIQGLVIVLFVIKFFDTSGWVHVATAILPPQRQNLGPSNIVSLLQQGNLNHLNVRWRRPQEVDPQKMSLTDQYLEFLVTRSMFWIQPSPKQYFGPK